MQRWFKWFMFVGAQFLGGVLSSLLLATIFMQRRWLVGFGGVFFCIFPVVAGLQQQYSPVLLLYTRDRAGGFLLHVSRPC